MITTLIIEDEPLSVKYLEGIITRSCPMLTVVGTACSVADAFEQIHRLKPDLVFLDIELAGQSSFDLLRQLPHAGFEIIFVTAHDTFGIQAVKHNAADYILKPVNKIEFLNAVEKVSKRIHAKRPGAPAANLKASPARLALPSMQGLILVDLDKIAYCESEGRYTRFYFADGNKKILVSKNLGEYEAILPPDLFVRIHHHAIVNMLYVCKYVKGRGGYVVMTDGKQLPVSIRKKELFLEWLS